MLNNILSARVEIISNWQFESVNIRKTEYINVKMKK